MPQIRFLLTALTLVAICASSARAATFDIGDTLTYASVSSSKVTGVSLPAGYKTPPQATTTFSIAVTNVAPDGIALVHVKVYRSVPAGSFNPIQQKAWDDVQRGNEFDAKLTPNGALLIAVDNSPDQIPAQGGSASGRPLSQADLAKYRDAIVAQGNDPAYKAKQTANAAAGVFTVPNLVALSSAQRNTLNVGDAWRVADSSSGLAATYDVAVTGRQSFAGHDVVVLSAKTKADNPNGSYSIEATVYYDPKARLIVGMHEDTANNIHIAGAASSTSTSDLTLKQ